jgi:hypothetical protein
MATEVSAETKQVAEVASAAVMTTKAAQTRKKWNAISYQRNRSAAVSVLHIDSVASQGSNRRPRRSKRYDATQARGEPLAEGEFLYRNLLRYDP